MPCTTLRCLPQACRAGHEVRPLILLFLLLHQPPCQRLQGPPALVLVHSCAQCWASSTMRSRKPMAEAHTG